MNLIKEIKKIIPYNEQEENDKRLILNYLNIFKDDILTRNNELCHFTVSNWITNKNHNKILMIYHNIYNSWAWTGGHADGDSNLLRVAKKKAYEETGIKNLTLLTPDIASIEILTVNPHIKRGRYVSSHLHLNCTYIFEADEKDLIRIKEDENSNVGWIDISKINDVVNEEHMKPIYEKLNKKLLNIK